MIRRAILSVSDKRGIIELARFLTARGVEILSTGGTSRHLGEASITVTPISAWSGAPEILGGRVKTLTPKVFGAILYDRDRSDHVSDCEANQIPPVDLVVVNLYPFESTIVREGVSLAEAIEQIDVGGPSMLRAAAKNHAHVIPLCSPDLYEEFMREVESGAVSEDFRRRAALEVFRLTARYDRAIAAYLETTQPGTRNLEPGTLPATLHLDLTREQSLRYGENPQQQAAFYRHAGQRGGSFRQLQGKDLSYNNLIDLDAAWKLAMAFEAPACAIIKHTNPCGVATGASTDDALGAAIASDPVSAFGGVVGVNGPFTAEAARLVESLFFEVIIAPGFSPEAQDMLAKKKNLRLIETAGLPPVTLQLRSAADGILAQTADRLAPSGDWKCVTKRQPAQAERKALEFAWIVCAHVKSNAIVLASERQSIGVGAGQMSRVDSARIAVMKAVLPLQGAVAASDAFFPFRDGLDILSEAGISAVVQPGGSVRDEQVIAAANERNIAMLFTGERHFRH